MKKIVLTLAAMLSMTMAFAENSDKNNVETKKAPEVTATNMRNNYDMSLNYNSLASTLGLNSYQAEAVQLIHNKFVGEMNEVAQADATDRSAMVKQAADKELKYMSYILTRDQYRKFTMLLNVTLHNRGLLN
ncbi:MAG: hypothetical protein ACOYJK_05420 [Prevotella sp.]|jgi:hypothetical protein